MVRYCFDIDGTVFHAKHPDESYDDIVPIDGMPELIRSLHRDGNYVILHTARNMKTHSNNIGKIIAKQVPIIIQSCQRYDIPYDELLVGKPLADIYIDDKGYQFKTTKQLKEDLGIL
jgi:capsule biosynthesis phosphatase